MEQRKGSVMGKTNWRRLVGLALATVGLFCLYDFLFSNGIAVRGKGFDYPLIDPNQLREAALSFTVVVLGACLFLWGSKRR